MNLRKLAVAFSGGFPDNPSLKDQTVYGIVIFLVDFAGQSILAKSLVSATESIHLMRTFISSVAF